MDLQTSLLLNFNCFHQDNKSTNELRQSLLLTMELEETRRRAQEELKARDQEIARLKDLLAAAIKDKNEALEKYQKLMNEEDNRNNAFSSSDCDESIVSSPHHLPQAAAPEPDYDLPLPIDRPLPEKGKFLQAVMKAGPLLQTLLLAGPLPQWRHPPPPLDTYEIPPPPVVIPMENVSSGNCRAMDRKRGASEMSYYSGINEVKYQRIVLQ